MNDNLNILIEVTGALSGLIATIISILTYIETRNSRKYGSNYTDAPNEIVSNSGIFKKEVILFDKYHKRTTVFIGLLFWASVGITYGNTNEWGIAVIVGFSFMAFSYITIIIPFLNYWKRRIRNSIKSTNIIEAKEFINNYKWKDLDSKNIIEKMI